MAEATSTGPLELQIAVSPHLRKGTTTAQIMWTVSATLLPAAAWGVFSFGLQALWNLLASISAAVLAEYVFTRVLKRGSILDGSAFLTGLLVGFNMPPSVPLFVPVVASLFALAIAKWAFGGLGANWANPALTGRLFAFFSWTGFMTRWTPPRLWGLADAVSSASPLGAVKAGLVEGLGGAAGPLDYLNAAAYPISGADRAVTAWLERLLGTRVPNGYVDLFLGNVPGCIGEVSSLLLLAGAIYLMARRIAAWEISVSYIGTFALLVWVLGGTKFGQGLFRGDVLFHLFSGGLMLGALYMATDMVTSPLTSKGMVIFGVGCGFVTFMIRYFGSFPEGVSLAIVLMNMFVPLINRLTPPRKFGAVKEARP